jgi:phosphoserine phosphatase
MHTPPFRSLWFDCDSTLSSIEGVDELRGRLSLALQDEILALTEQAMEGALPLADVYEKRLHVIAPSRDQLVGLGGLYVERALPHVRLLVEALHALGKTVGIVSGGLLPAVEVLAAHLGVPRRHVHAVALRFDGAGRYLDFDRSSPLWRNGGKPEVLRGLDPALRPLVFVGDGATDLETKGVAELFVGFGGIARRPAVAAGADSWLPGPDLCGLLPLALTADERQRLRGEPRFRELFHP